MQIRRKTSWQLWLVHFLSFAGILTCFVLTLHFYDIRNGSAGFKTFCNISQTMNCDVVAASTKAELISGVPLSSFAMGWFLAFFIISLLTRKPERRKEGLKAMFVMAASGFIASLFYLSVMALQLKTYCILCLAVDALNLLLLVVLWSALPAQAFQKFQDTKWNQWRHFALVGALSIAGVVGTLRIFDESSFSIKDIDLLVKTILSTPSVPISVAEDSPYMGPKDAPITIVEFSDFQCPYCRMGAFMLHTAANRFPNRIRIIFKHFPLNKDCNSEIAETAHPMACEAASAAVCAHQQGHFEEAYHQLFEEQETFLPGRPLEILESLNADFDLKSKFSISQLEGCISSPETSSQISRDVAEGRALEVRSTPTFFINGHKREGLLPVPAWNKIFEKLLMR